MYSIRIYIDDLVPNAFIAYFINNNSKSNPKNLNRKLNLLKIEKFGKQICDNLNRKKIPAKVILSNDLSEVFFRNNHEWFTLADNGYVLLNDSVTVDDLIENFSEYLPNDLIIEFSKRKNTKILLENP